MTSTPVSGDNLRHFDNFIIYRNFISFFNFPPKNRIFQPKLDLRFNDPKKMKISKLKWDEDDF